MENENRFNSTELPSSYLIETEDGISINVERFYDNLLENRQQIVLQETFNRIERETESIKMGNTSVKNLTACETYLNDNDIKVEDPTFAVHISVLRIFKKLPAFYTLTESDIPKEKLLEVLNTFVRSVQIGDEALREKFLVNNQMVTLDHITQEHGAPTNIQKHVSLEELGQTVLPITMLLFKRVYYNELEDIGGRT